MKTVAAKSIQSGGLGKVQNSAHAVVGENFFHVTVSNNSGDRNFRPANAVIPVLNSNGVPKELKGQNVVGGVLPISQGATVRAGKSASLDLFIRQLAKTAKAKKEGYTFSISIKHFVLSCQFRKGFKRVHVEKVIAIVNAVQSIS